jgi:hypothetical protein
MLPFRPPFASGIFQLSLAYHRRLNIFAAFVPIATTGASRPSWRRFQLVAVNVCHQSRYHLDWFKGKSTPETMVFTIKYRGFL